MDALTKLHNSTAIYNLLREVESARLAAELGAHRLFSENMHAAPQLRVAATLALVELIGEESVDDFLRQASASNDNASPNQRQLETFEKWTGYIDALLDANETPTLEDLLLFSCSGFLARRPTEVRSILRSGVIRRILDDGLNSTMDFPWPDRVRSNIGTALLLLVRQGNHEDVYRQVRRYICLHRTSKLRKQLGLKNMGRHSMMP